MHLLRMRCRCVCVHISKFSWTGSGAQLKRAAPSVPKAASCQTCHFLLAWQHPWFTTECGATTGRRRTDRNDKRTARRRTRRRQKDRMRRGVQMMHLISGDVLPEKSDMYLSVRWNEGLKYASKGKQTARTTGVSDCRSETFRLVSFQ